MGQEAAGRSGNHCQARLGGDGGLHGCAVELSVGLRTRSTNGRTLRPVQQSKLDACLVCDPAHQAVQRIDLPDEVSLAKTPDCRVTGHLANRIGTVRQEDCPGPGARCGGRCFGSRMSASDHDHIEVVRHEDCLRQADTKVKMRTCFT